LCWIAIKANDQQGDVNLSYFSNQEPITIIHKLTGEKVQCDSSSNVRNKHHYATYNK